MSIKKANSLGFFKDPKDTKVVVAMSGGVDSSSVAGLMKKENYDVKPIFLIGVPRSGSTLVERIIGSGENIIPIGDGLTICIKK